MRRRASLAIVGATLLAVAGAPACGAAAPPRTAAPAARLTIVYRPAGAHPRVRRWTLTCRPAGGTHPRPRAACRELRRHGADLHPRNPECQILRAGSERAHVTGRVGRRRIDFHAIDCSRAWRTLPVLLRGR